MKIQQLAIPAIALALSACATTQPHDQEALKEVPLAPVQSNVTFASANSALGNTPAPTIQEADPMAPRIIRGTDKVIGDPKSQPPLVGGNYAFSFEDAPIGEVVQVIMRDVIKADFVLHQPVAGSVTMITKAQVSADQAMAMLEAALQTNGLGLARDTRGVYHVGRVEILKGIGASTRVVPKTGVLPPGYGAIIVPLQYIGAGEMATILRPMMQGDSLLRVDSLRNLLVLSGTRAQAEGWLELVATFDVDLLKGMSVGVFPLKYATIQEVQAALALVSGNAGAASAGGASAGAAAPRAPAVPRPGGATNADAGAPAMASMLGEGNPLFGAVRVMPIERLNSILVVTPRAAYLEEVRRWIEKLDQPSENNSEAQLFIYKVQNVNAVHLSSVLNGIFGGQSAPSSAPVRNGVAPGLTTAVGSSFGQGSSPFGGGSFGGGSFGSNNQGRSNNTGFGGGLGVRNSGGQGGAVGQGFGGVGGVGGNGATNFGQAPTVSTLGNIRVMADELNNSVLIWSSKAEYAKIEATLKRIDLPLTQVLIEATIVEVTLNDDLKYGLQWAFSDSRNGTNYTGRGIISGNPVSNGVLGSAVTQGFSYTLSNSLGNVRAVLSALATKSLIKVISSPSLMVLDNHTATINVGDQQPIQTSVTSFVDNTNASTSTIQYKDTGVNLVVTPSVNSANVVTMQVDQTVTDIGPPQSSAGGQPSFLQRQISSKVAVRSGETIVLGGLIKDNQSTGKAGVPFLQDVPLFGNLFGTNTLNGNRTELLVVITPRVVRTDVDIRQVSEDLRERMQGLKRVGGFDAVYKPHPLLAPPVPPEPILMTPDMPTPEPSQPVPGTVVN